ncbi:recombinase family protein [Streptomyces sp. NPDC050508]|uniref:recombinase family protein n=1 Tax=Streptomyces sp. NPDC050508 TaxID=3155405 RepID=UPI0034163F91
MDLAYCRVATTGKDLMRQIDAMRAAGVAEEHIYVDKRTGANMDREGLTALLGFARPGDRINVLTLDGMGRDMRETLNLVHDLTERGIFLRTLGDKLAVDNSEPGPGVDMAIALLAMFAQMGRIYMLERTAGARASQEAPRVAGRLPGEARRDYPSRSCSADQGWRDPRAGRRRPRRQPLHSLPGTPHAPRRRRCRTGRTGKLTSGPGHIAAGR